MKRVFGKLKKISVLLLLGLLGLGLCFLMLEFGLRLALFGSLQWQQSGYLPFIRVPHPEFGWLPDSNQTAAEDAIEYQHLVSTNDKGLRDKAHKYEKPAGTFRIVVLGDSYMEGTHVPDGKAFPQVLESLLASRGVEVVNLGVSGFATTAEWLYLQEEGIKYQPDMVLLAFFAENDLLGNSAELSRVFWGADNIRYYGQPYASWDEEIGAIRIMPPDYERSYAVYLSEVAEYSPGMYQLEALRKSLASRLFQRMRYRLLNLVRTPGKDVNIHFGCYIENFDVTFAPALLPAETYRKLWDDTWNVTRQLVSTINTFCIEKNTKFALFNCPSRIQFEKRYQDSVTQAYPGLALNVDLPDQRLEKFCAESAIPFTTLLPTFRKAEAEGRELNYFNDSHWNEEGHLLAAQIIAGWLDEKGLLAFTP